MVKNPPVNAGDMSSTPANAGDLSSILVQADSSLLRATKPVNHNQ